MSLSISFSGEASEAFAEWVDGRRDWYVRITPQDGEPFDAILLGSGQDYLIDGEPWNDSVEFLRADPETGIALDGAKPEALRVTDVHVY